MINAVIKRSDCTHVSDLDEIHNREQLFGEVIHCETEVISHTSYPREHDIVLYTVHITI